MGKMVNTSPNFQKCCALIKKAQEILNTQRGTPVARGVEGLVCTLFAWFSWYMQCEWLEDV